MGISFRRVKKKTQPKVRRTLSTSTLYQVNALHNPHFSRPPTRDHRTDLPALAVNGRNNSFLAVSPPSCVVAVEAAPLLQQNSDVDSPYFFFSFTHVHTLWASPYPCGSPGMLPGTLHMALSKWDILLLHLFNCVEQKYSEPVFITLCKLNLGMVICIHTYAESRYRALPSP